MEIGKKYINAVKQQADRNNCTFIFLGFAFGSTNQGYFIKDDQELFDFLGEPYSQEAVKRMDFFNTQKGERTIYTFEWCDKTEWLDEETIEKNLIKLQKEMDALSELRIGVSKPTFYGCDCPNGSVYSEFIAEFKKGCANKGLSTKGFTFHGRQDVNNLSVCHNGNQEEDCDGVMQSDVFFALAEEDKYSRINTCYSRGSNQPEVK